MDIQVRLTTPAQDKCGYNIAFNVKTGGDYPSSGDSSSQAPSSDSDPSDDDDDVDEETPMSGQVVLENGSGGSSP